MLCKVTDSPPQSRPAIRTEHALAHQLPDAVERAYRRGTALPKRKLLMQTWADYCDGAEIADNVTRLHGG